MLQCVRASLKATHTCTQTPEIEGPLYVEQGWNYMSFQSQRWDGQSKSELHKHIQLW